jgi:hypothetical protein
VALFGFVISRVLFVARGDVPVALAIISAIGPITVVVNTIVASIEILAFVFLVVLLRFLEPGRIGPQWQNPIRLVLLLLVAVLAFTAPWPFLAIALFQIIFRVIVYRQSRKDLSVTSTATKSAAMDTREFLAAEDRDLFVPVALLAAYLMLSPVWLPAEAIKLNSNKQPTVGYVLNDQSDWYSILADNPRTILRVEKTGVKDRSVCLTEDQASRAKLTTIRTVQRLLGHPTTFAEPLCSEL